MDKFFVCLVEGSNGGYGKQHPNFEEAEEESKRLARLPANEGKKVFILECLGATVVNNTDWIPVKQDGELPF
jgi:hypothetical protein